jgi:hypothetical protein
MHISWQHLALSLVLALIAGGIMLYTGMHRAIEGAFSRIEQKGTSDKLTADESEDQGSTLLQRCTTALQVGDSMQWDKITGIEFGWCFGYLSGIREGHVMAKAATLYSGLSICPPDEWLPLPQLAQGLVKWRRTHPTLLHLDRTALATLAFRDIFPCREADTPPEPKAEKGK